MSKNYDGFDAKEKRLLFNGMVTRSRQSDPGRFKAGGRYPNPGGWGLFVVLVIIVLMATCLSGGKFK